MSDTGHKPLSPRFCGQGKTLIRNREFDPSTDVHRLVHRRRASHAHRGEFGRLPHSRFRPNVNRPRDTGQRKSRETLDLQRTGPALRPGASGDLRIVTCDSRDPGSSPRRSSDRRQTGEPDRDRRTTRTQCRGTPKTRSATGYSRPPFRVRPKRRRRQGPDPNGQVQPGLGEGTKSTGPPARFVPSLNCGADNAAD